MKKLILLFLFPIAVNAQSFKNKWKSDTISRLQIRIDTCANCYFFLPVSQVFLCSNCAHPFYKHDESSGSWFASSDKINWTEIEFEEIQKYQLYKLVK